MFRRLLDVWLPRCLFCATLGVALVLGGAVLAAPWLTGPDSAALLKLFAEDAAVRRVALFSAGGLTVTAFLFFRTHDPDADQPPRQPPKTMAGA